MIGFIRTDLLPWQVYGSKLLQWSSSLNDSDHYHDGAGYQQDMNEFTPMQPPINPTTTIKFDGGMVPTETYFSNNLLLFNPRGLNQTDPLSDRLRFRIELTSQTGLSEIQDSGQQGLSCSIRERSTVVYFTIRLFFTDLTPLTLLAI